MICWSLACRRRASNMPLDAVVVGVDLHVGQDDRGRLAVLGEQPGEGEKCQLAAAFAD